MLQKNSSHIGMLHISAAGSTDRGRVREHNEDAIALCEPLEQSLVQQLGSLYLLADGVGGHAAGEVASHLAIDTIASVYYGQTTVQESAVANTLSRHGERQAHEQRAISDMDRARSRIQQAFLTAHRRLLQEAALHPVYSGMATTCVSAIVKDTRLLIAHIGDSRAYLIKSTASNPTMTCLTTDHSMAMELVRARVISPEQMHTSPARHILSRTLGGHEREHGGPDIIPCDVSNGDRLVLCCDGLWSMVSEKHIAAAVSKHTPQAACSELIRLANKAGGKDNISVIVLSFT